MWTYAVRETAMSRDGAFEGFGYSGHGLGLNDPDKSSLRGVGPVPVGKYTIDEWHDEPHLGPCVAFLNPDSNNEMFGRSGFYIHGDNADADHSASDGCIIMGPNIRHAMRDSQDSKLIVQP